MATTKNTRGTRKLAEDDPRHGATAQPPLLMLIIGALEIAAWLWCNNQQIATTHDAVFGLLQSSTILPAHATASLVMTILQDNLDKNNKIAYSIAIVAQIMFLISAFPISRIWGRMAASQGYHPSGNSFKAHAQEISRYLNRRRILFILFFIGDVLSDLRYVQISSREWMVPLLYILAMYVGSTIIGLDGWQRLAGAFMTWFSDSKYRAQHERQEQENA